MYTVIQTRVVPASTTNTTLVLKKTVTTPNAHANEYAVLVKLQNGNIAWGFSPDRQDAESSAVKAANGI